MKPDADLLHDVKEELEWEPALRGVGIQATVDHGTVMLAGQVNSLAAKVAAEKAAKRVQGVKAVVQELTVKPLSCQPSDQNISRVIQNILEWHCEVPNESVQVQVQNGYVTLAGEVDWPYQKHAAEKAVRYILGVQGVTNLIRIKPRTVQEIRAAIAEALHRNAGLEEKRINVEVAGSKVTLNGWVHSWMERAMVEKVVWSAPGVTSVEDNIVVAH